MPERVILGAGMTGLAASIASGLPVYEASSEPGGICSSYYVRPDNDERLPEAPEDGEAYTWSWPGSGWKQKALRQLEEQGIYQVGRYGRWVFQGIADSIRDGFLVGASLKNYT